MFYSFERILLTLWIGSMLTVGFLVAPVLFNTLDNRALAGLLAGDMFTNVSYIGLGIGPVLLIRQFVVHGLPSRQHWLSTILIIMLVIICIGEFVLQPQMAALKLAGLEGEVMKQFERLHGIASVLYVINSILGVVLVALWHKS